MCMPIKPISEKQKQFERALQEALEQYLQRKTYLTNREGVRFYVGKPACGVVCLASRMEFDKVELVVESNTNYHPCLQAHVTLSIKKEGDSKYDEVQYFFHISGDKSAIGGDADYEVRCKNDELTIVIKHVDYFFKDGNRLF